MNKQLSTIFKLFSSVLFTLMVGGAGAILTNTSVRDWYTTINKPFFNPPNLIFGPVWTTLYILMGFSLCLVWKSKSKLKTKAISIYLLQLGLNFTWSLCFFYLQNPLLAFFEILILLVSIVWMMSVFKKISLLSFQLLIPYLAWVSFATILNLSIVILNFSTLLEG